MTVAPHTLGMDTELRREYEEFQQTGMTRDTFPSPQCMEGIRITTVLQVIFLLGRSYPLPFDETAYGFGHGVIRGQFQAFEGHGVSPVVLARGE